MQNPFESIESAQQYISLLLQQVHEVEASVLEELTLTGDAARRTEALHLVNYKLDQLKTHLTASGRMLNDLRVLRRLLLGERERSDVTAYDRTHQESL